MKVDWERKFYNMLDEKNRYKDLYKLFGRPVCSNLKLEYDPHGNIPRCNKAKDGYCEGICEDYMEVKGE